MAILTAQKKFSFIIPCHNEAHNLLRLLNQLSKIKFKGNSPTSIIIVSDNSNDGTDSIASKFALEALIPTKLIISKTHIGKASAINLACQSLVDTDIIISVSGDVLPQENCIELMLEAFDDQNIAVVGGRPVLDESPKHLAEHVSALMWKLHHLIVMDFPKSTEITAFKNLGWKLDETTLVDEAEIDQFAFKAGYKIKYLPEAKILTNSPTTISQYIAQRTRVTLGYLTQRKNNKQIPNTLFLRNRINAVTKLLKENPSNILIIFFSATLEMIIYLSALTQSLLNKKSNGIWARINSSKRPFADK